MDPADGNVLAMVGGRDFFDSEFNRATQAQRQPGSLFKPFVYTAAVESGIPASEVIFDTPVEFPQPDSSIWSPSNFTNDFKGPVTIRDALAASINVVAVKLGLRVGLETVAQYAHRMGITTRVDRVPSTAIGSPSVRPIEMVEAYTTFANLGIRVTPRPILRIENVSLYRGRCREGGPSPGPYGVGGALEASLQPGRLHRHRTGSVSRRRPASSRPSPRAGVESPRCTGGTDLYRVRIR